MKMILLFALLMPTYSFAEFGLKPIKKEYKDVLKESEVGVTNMPKVRSQDTLGLCYSFVATTLFDEARCAESKTPVKCSERPDDQRSSPLDMAKFSQKISEDDSIFIESYNEGIKEGGHTVLTLRNGALQVGSVAKESCSPFDQVVAKTKDPAQAREIEMKLFTNLQKKYKGFRDQKKKDCADCDLTYATALSNELGENYNLKASNTDILKALSEDSYDLFLEKLLVPEKCVSDDKNRLELKSSWDVDFFPTGKEKKSVKYDEAISKVKELLKEKRPIGLEFCAQDPLKAKKGKDCKDTVSGGMGHAVVIKGYRRVCKTNNSKDCYDAVQVQNSWGESWQRQNNDGWVDAKELLDRTFYEPFTMSWLKPLK